MTMAALPPRRRDHLSLAAEVEVLHLVLDDLHATPVTADDAGLLSEVDRARRRLEALRFKVISAAEAGGAAQREGQATIADWVARQTRTDRQTSGRDSALARALTGTDGQSALDATGTALAAGELSAAHARVIADALRRLPDGVAPGQRRACERRLVDDASRLDPAQLRRRARRILDEIEADPVVVDAAENDQLVSEEDAAYQRSRLTFHDNGDGTTTGSFTLPRLQSDMLRKLIDAMTAPRRTNGRDKRRARSAGTRRDQAEQNPFERDRTDPAHTRGLAFAQLLEHLPTDHLHGSATSQVTVLMDIETLMGHLRAAGLDTDHPISAGEARRMACNSGIVPAVFGRTLKGKSRILDLGRLSRLFTEAQRQAVTAMHTHCAARGCTRPVAWCELHHLTPWSRGGRTNLNDAVPLCGWHHRRIHDHRYTHTYEVDGSVDIRARV